MHGAMYLYSPICFHSPVPNYPLGQIYLYLTMTMIIVLAVIFVKNTYPLRISGVMNLLGRRATLKGTLCYEGRSIQMSAVTNTELSTVIKIP
jgi:hypothetical protein